MTCNEYVLVGEKSAAVMNGDIEHHHDSPIGMISIIFQEREKPLKSPNRINVIVNGRHDLSAEYDYGCQGIRR